MKDLYFMLNPVTGFIKIGVASDVEQRRRSLECASGVELEVLAVLRGGGQYERAAHEQFAADRRRGEWFAPDRLRPLLAEASLERLQAVLDCRETLPVAVASPGQALARYRPPTPQQLADAEDVARIRRKCREAFERHIPTLEQIITDPTIPKKDRMKAQSVLAKYAAR